MLSLLLFFSSPNPVAVILGIVYPPVFLAGRALALAWRLIFGVRLAMARCIHL